MKILQPVVIGDGALIACNIAEDDHAEWNENTSYTRGNLVISIATHRIYRALEDSTGVNPDLEQVALDSPFITNPDPVSWQIIGATNKWKLWDQKPSTPCVKADKITFTVRPGGLIQAISGFNIYASQVMIRVASGGTTAYETHINMVEKRNISTWFEYFTAPFNARSEFLITDLPVVYNADITLEITTKAGDVSVGQIVMGRLDTLGETLIEGTGFSGLDFSYVDTDDFGNLTTTRRHATRLSEYNIVVDTVNLSKIANKLYGLRGGVPAVWIGDDDPEKAVINYGFYRRYQVYYEEGKISYLEVEIQGIV